MNKRAPTVFIIDDDASVRVALERLLRSVELEVETFASGQEFLDAERADGPGCLVVDVRMPGFSGLDLQDELAARHVGMPVIFITGHGSIPTSVRAMKAGAVDFLQKPFDDQDLLDAIHRSLERNEKERQEQAEVSRLEQRVGFLTPREREVFALVVTGMLNKNIAGQLGTSEKTIKVHRSRVMEKMQAKSLAELVRMADKLVITPPKSNLS